MKKVIAIVLAAGKGKRFGKKKQYVKINGKELFIHSLCVFDKINIIDKILLVVDGESLKLVEQKIKKHKIKKVFNIIKGGKERYNSVYNAITFLKKEKPDYVIIHDAARPYFDINIVKKEIDILQKEIGVIPTKKIYDTVKEIKGNYVIRTLNRDILRTTHTPQAYRYDILEKIYTKKNLEKIKPTDESMMLEKMGYKVRFIEDTSFNIKITTKSDINILKNFYRGKK